MQGIDTNDKETAVPLSEQAAHWWVVLNGDAAGSADKQAFGEWVARSPERVEAYLRMARLMGALHGRRTSWPDVPAEVLVREARNAPADVTPLDRGRSGRASARRARSLDGRMLFGLAATVLAAVSAAWFVFSGPQHYGTALGEQRSVVLDDGSVVTLNTSSRIEVALDGQRRIVRLLQGEALFQVAQDRSRPFEVVAGQTAIRAVGTQFNVDRRDARTTVTVLEGRVIVGAAAGPDGGLADAPASPGAYLAAAERIVITDSGPGALERVLNVAPVTAWTQRRLVFERRPLAEVAEEFNRYNRRPILIEDQTLAGQAVTGVFQANDPASFITFLEEIPGVKVMSGGAGAHRVTRVP